MINRSTSRPNNIIINAKDSWLFNRFGASHIKLETLLTTAWIFTSFTMASSSSPLQLFMTNLMAEKQVNRMRVILDNVCTPETSAVSEFSKRRNSRTGNSNRHTSRNTITHKRRNRKNYHKCNWTSNEEPINLSRWKSSAVPPTLSAVLAKHRSSKESVSKSHGSKGFPQSAVSKNIKKLSKPLPTLLQHHQKQKQQQQQQHLKMYYSTVVPPRCPQRRFSLDSNSTHSSSAPLMFVERTRSSPQLGRFRRTLTTLH